MPGCLFCRHEIGNYRKVCVTCRSGFEKWVLDNIVVFKATAVHKLLCKYPSTYVAHYKGPARSWPGFYCGDGKWSKPQITSLPKVQPKWETERDMLDEVLQCNGIHINQDLQYATAI